jgi:hypothetical protein
MADAPAPDDSGIPPFHIFRALFALFVLGVGVYLIATANKPTETVTARVNYRYIPFSRADTVDFKFADGSNGNESQPGGLVDAVQKFGPGPARVTRNTENDSIYKVVFHDKTYSLSDPGEDRDGGIIAIVLGALYLGCALLWRVVNRMLPDPASPGEEPPVEREASDNTMDHKQIAKVVKRFFRANGGATLELPDGWFGRPFDNHHELSIVAWDGPLLRIVLDRHEPLTLLIREPQHADVDGRVLTIRAFAEASAELPYYGDRDHPTRLKKYTGGRFRFHA